jgi:hypothetical protein
MSSRRKRGGAAARGRQAPVAQPAADPDALLALDPSQAADAEEAAAAEAAAAGGGGGAAPPSPAPGAAALAARAVTPLVRALRSSARGLLGAEPGRPPGAPPHERDRGNGGGSAAEEAPDAATGVPGGGGDQDAGRGRRGRRAAVGLPSDDEGPPPGEEATGEEAPQDGGAAAAAPWPRLRRAVALAASRRALPLLVATLAGVLALQGAALSRQGAALGAYQRQLRQLEGRLAGDVAAALARAGARARKCSAGVEALGERQRGLAEGLAALEAAAVAAAGCAAPRAPTAAAAPACGAPGAGGVRRDDASLAAAVEALLKRHLPPPDLALAACGATIAAHSPLALRRLPWRQAARAGLAGVAQRFWGARGRRGGGGDAQLAPHPAADGLLLSPRQLPGACLPLELGSGKRGAPAFVDVRLPGPAALTAVELTLLLPPSPPPPPGPATPAATLSSPAAQLPPSAPRDVAVRPLNFSGSPVGAAQAPPGAAPAARLTIGPASLVPGAGGRAKAVLPLSSGGPVVADGVRLEVASAQGGREGFVCLHRVAVRGAPLGGGSFC